MKIVCNVLLVLCVMVFSGCASIVSKSSWPLTINTNPSGAKIEITNKQGLTVFNGVSPATMKLTSYGGFFAKQSYRVRLSLDGYAEKIIPVECRLNGWYIGNIVFGGLIGFLIVDPATGAMFRLDAEYINESLAKLSVHSEAALNVVDINSIPAEMKKHLVAINK